MTCEMGVRCAGVTWTETIVSGSFSAFPQPAKDNTTKTAMPNARAEIEYSRYSRLANLMGVEVPPSRSVSLPAPLDSAPRRPDTRCLPVPRWSVHRLLRVLWLHHSCTATWSTGGFQRQAPPNGSIL